MKLKDLAAEFPREAVHWRAQTVTKDGTKALALAYLDARDVMDRLDEVCGPENWQSRYVETPKGRVLCEIGIKVGDEWIWKSDGAGDTAVEGEKGGISDSLKRAAVQWGIGRYLYRLKAPWVPCQCSEWNGKKQWKKWTADPWQFVSAPAKQAAPPEPEPELNHRAAADRIIASLNKAGTIADLRERWNIDAETIAIIKDEKPPMYGEINAAKDKRKSELEQKEAA